MQSPRPVIPISSLSEAAKRLLAMPIRQYFVWVGSALLVALFAADWWFPAPPAPSHYAPPPNERVNLRIRSDHKWPERVVFDTVHLGVPLAAEIEPEPHVAPGQDLARAGQRSPLDAFAAMAAAQVDLRRRLPATRWPDKETT